jgi:hypothetical protein
MTRNQTVLALGFAFVIGCLAGPALLSRAVAQGQPPHYRFEYLCQKIGKPWQPDDLQRMNQLGAQGWDMIQQLVGQQ